MGPVKIFSFSKSPSSGLECRLWLTQNVRSVVFICLVWCCWAFPVQASAAEGAEGVSPSLLSDAFHWEGRGSGPPTGPQSHPLCSPGVSEREGGISVKPVRTDRLPGYSHWFSCLFLAFSLTPQNFSAERGSLRPSAGRVLCLSSGYSWCLSNLMYPERLLFDPGPQCVCQHVILLVGQGLVNARPG